MSNLVQFDIDLTMHEGTRLAAVLDAMGSDWDPAEIYAGEAEAYRRLYSGLDATQRSCYDLLVTAGVLPEAAEWST